MEGLREKQNLFKCQLKTMPRGPIISKQKQIKRNKIADIGYVVIETKRSIT